MFKPQSSKNIALLAMRSPVQTVRPKTYVGDKKVMLRSQSVTPCQSVEAVFNLQGVRMRGKLETLPIGIYLVRYTDGRVRRVLR